MLHISKISKSYGANTILQDISFVINRRERVGLVGPNGCGKTTVLQIIAGVEPADSGRVNIAPSVTLGYLPQGLPRMAQRELGEYIRSGRRDWDEARQEVERLAAALVHDPSLLDTYGDELSRFEARGGYAVEHQIKEILIGLGLGQLELSRRVDQLSEGQRTRIGLARLLIGDPDLLLLDEPTNHLDIQALEWLEQFLRDYRGAVLIVSHDRTLLDRTVARVLELDETTHRVKEYFGNYSEYAAIKERERGKQWAAWKDQQAEVRRLEQDIARTKEQARHNEQATINDHTRRLAKKVAKKAVAREKRLRRYLESQDRVEKPKQTWRMKLEFGEMPRGGQIVVTLKDTTHAYRVGEVAERADVFRHLNLTLRHGERVALVGPNGAGKTTLLRIIAGEIAPTEGQVYLGANVRLGYMPQDQATLDAQATPLEVIRAMAPMSETQARNFLHFFLFEDDEVFVPIGKLSFGERARLLLAQLVVQGANCLLLDEPINHLDIPSRERFQAALEAFPGTILVAVHDRAFIDRFATGIWSLESQTIRQYLDRDEMTRVR